MNMFRRGVTLLELIIVAAVGSIIAGILVSSFVNLNQGNGLEKSANLITGMLAEARSKTLASKNATVYGVHMASTTVTLFAGNSYVSGATGNLTETFSNVAQIQGISLAGGGTDVVFNRLTGDTDDYGTITLTLNASSTQKKIITIFSSGLSSY